MSKQFLTSNLDFLVNHHYLHTMLTPKQQSLLNNPAVQLLITELDCQVQPSYEYKFNNAVSSQVNNWLNSFQQATHKPRTISTEGKVLVEPEIVRYSAPIEATYTFKAWRSVAGKTITCIF